MRGLVRAGHAGRRVRSELRPVLRARAPSRRPTKSSSSRRSPDAWAASTSRTCATRRRACSTASARRSKSARRAACRRRSRTTRSSARRTGARSVDTLKLVDEARARGVDATIDQYPYTASSDEHPGGADAGVGARGRPRGGAEAAADARRCATSCARRRRASSSRSAAAAIRRTCSSRAATGITSLDGKRLGDVTKGRGLEPTIENAAETALWIVEKGGCRRHLPRDRAKRICSASCGIRRR